MRSLQWYKRGAAYQLRLIVVVVNVNLYDHSILVQIPGKYNRFKILNDKKKEKDGDK